MEGFKIWFVAICIATFVRCGICLIPTICVGNVTSPEARCCPIPYGFKEPCGGVGRGVCKELETYKEYDHYNEDIAQDDRIMWPKRFLKYTCHCEARFWGYDCGECWFGWKGIYCNERDVRVRRNIFSFDKTEKEMYQKMTLLMREKPSPYSILIERDTRGSDPLRNPKFVPASVHYHLVYIHRYASRKTLFTSKEQCQQVGKMDMNHGGPGFITWHRYFTLQLERELAKIAEEKFGWKDFALPYWDWVDATYCEVCHNDLVGLPGECDENGQRLHADSPFNEWDEFCSQPENIAKTGSCFGCHARERFKKLVRQWKNLVYPTTEEVEWVLSRKDYYVPGEWEMDVSPRDLSKCSFSKAFEGHCGPEHFYGHLGLMHNKVHDSTNGSFCCSATAPNDPIFFLHHSQLERILHLWFVRHEPHEVEMATLFTMPGHSRLSNMVGFYPPITHAQVFSSIQSLGYTYDTFEFGYKNKQKHLHRMPRPTRYHFETCKPGFLHHKEFERHEKEIE